MKRITRDLTAEGYKFFPTPANPFLYKVDLNEGACSCIAGQRGIACCHKKEAAKRVLVMFTARR